MKSLPGNVVSYTKTKIFTEETIPEKLTKEHDTKDGTWAVIHVVEGRLNYTILGETEETVELTPDKPGVVSPGEKHFIRPDGPVKVCLEFYREE